MNGNNLVLAEDIHFSYGKRVVLQGLELSVGKGEMLGLVGPNGSGKTTLLRIISAVCKPQRGQVYLAGQPLCALRPRDRARLVATVPQNPAVPPGFTALEVVLMGRNPHLSLLQWEGPKDFKISRRVMELTETWEFRNRLLSSLSGGERQRVFMARALAQETPLLLLDEPTANLDVGYQTAIMDMVERIRQEAQVTVITAIHDLTLAARYCDRLVMLREGKIAAQGLPREVLTPESIEKVYNTRVCVVPHPVHGTIVVLPVSASSVTQEGHPSSIKGLPMDGRDEAKG